MSEEQSESAYSEPIVDDEPFSVRVEIRNVPVGTKLVLRNGAIVEVTANPADGGWLFVRYVEYDQDPSKFGTEDMVFCVDVVGVV